MKQYIILPDITCDLSKEIRDYFGVVDYIKGHVHINGKSITTSLDWDNISRKEFYNTLSNKKNEVNIYLIGLSILFILKFIFISH